MPVYPPKRLQMFQLKQRQRKKKDLAFQKLVVKMVQPINKS